jgi:uncharacterized repeat protein (TIGR01451 family)
MATKKPHKHKKAKANDEVEQVKEELKSETKEREQDIQTSLAQLYQDENGEIINVKEVRIKKGRKHFGLLSALIYIAVFILVFYGIYFFVNRNNSGSHIDFLIETDKEQVVGQEFVYTVKYQNLDRVGLNNIQIKLDYPDGFIFLDSDPKPDQRNDVWSINRLEPHLGGEIKIKGKLVDKLDTKQMILGEMYYTPDNFNSEFRQDTDLETALTKPGIDLEVVPPANLFVNDPAILVINYSALEALLDNFKLEVIPSNPDNIKFIASTLDDGKNETNLEQAEPWVWGIGDINADKKAIKIKFVAKERVNSTEKFTIRLSYQNKDLIKVDDFISEGQNLLVPDDTVNNMTTQTKPADTEKIDDNVSIDKNVTAEAKPITDSAVDDLLIEQNSNLDIKQNKEYYTFYEQEFEAEVVQNSLNLTLNVNGSSNDLGADFGDELNYEVSYNNKGKATMKNVVVMAILEGDALDWSTLQTTGKRNENTIIWTPQNTEELKEIAINQSGKLTFKIKLKDSQAVNNKSTQIKGYAQFTTFTEDEDGKQTTVKTDNNLSNTLLVKINSDLNLSESLRYYTKDNEAVGTGPLPPKVGQTTTFKAYWTINNSLHNLKHVQISTDLPTNVTWNSKDLSSVGNLHYDQYDNRIIWDLDEVNVLDDAPTAEFSLSITPTDADADKILIILNNTKIVALDTETNEEITKTNKAKTTKLEDDNMIDNDGVVKK